MTKENRTSSTSKGSLSYKDPEYLRQRQKDFYADNKERSKYTKQKSACRSFLREWANLDDLVEMEEYIMLRLKAGAVEE